MITHISPLGSMDMLSQLEVDMLKRTASSDLYQLFRNCSLAVLNSGSLTDNSKELLSRFENFDINVLRRERGVKLELINPPEDAFVDGRIIRALQANLFAVLRDILFVNGQIHNAGRFQHLDLESSTHIMEEQHLWGHLDWDNKTLTVTTSAAAPAQDTATTISPAAMVTTSTSPESPTTANSQNKPRNPFRGNSVSSSTPAATPTPTGSTVKSIPLMTGTPVKPVSQGKEWRAPAGTTLRENIIKWAEETKCESMASTHWMVIWPLSVTDYRLDAPLMFRGSFESAMEQVFELYRTAQKPLYAQASRMQCIITVSDTRDGR
ncbi:DUF4478 domain-containing protein [Salmonella enterica subsp. enterica serovar Heidelberg]|nr:DUF4478 domain-containing protein [Salmonella enterica subsp. enterica serovar Heidelberg]EBX8309055.1 DUF4478 domain-containing protein [Salmonella enterica subsp. enterica serovar Heidelberg]MDJ4010415.1 pyrimidine/purine nucleosidase domain-containing protein [Salmonella enterica]